MRAAPLVLLSLLVGCAERGVDVLGAGPTPQVSDTTVRMGLSAWRRHRPDGACAGCHMPDASDLARLAFTDGEILRGAMAFGAPAQDGWAIVGLVRRQRERLGIVAPIDPTVVRPLQPAGAPLPGATAAERDLALWPELTRRLPRLTGAAVATLDDARAVMNEVALLDPRQLPVAMRFPPWSAASRGDDALAGVDDWLPDVATTPPADGAAAWYTLHDAYIEQPSAAALWAVLEAADGWPTGTDPLARYGRAEYRAMLVAGHMLGRGTSDMPAPASLDPETATRDELERESARVGRRWNVLGARGGPVHDLNTNLVFMTVPPQLADKARPTGTRTDGGWDYQLTRVAATAAWAQFTMDPAGHFHLRFEGLDEALRILTDGRHGARAESLSLHRLFAAATRLMRARSTLDSRYLFGDPAGFLANGDFSYLDEGCDLLPFVGRLVASGDPRREPMRKLLVNATSTLLLLRAEFVQREQVVNERSRWTGCAADWRTFLLAQASDAERAGALTALDTLVGAVPPAREGSWQVTRARARQGAVPFAAAGASGEPTPLFVPPAAAMRAPSPVGERYGQLCAACHGAEARGGSAVSRRWPIGPALVARDFAAFAAAVRRGGPRMPGFDEAQISTEALRALYDGLPRGN